MATQSGRKTIFGKSCQYTLWVKHFVEIALSHLVSEINTFLHFTQVQDGCQKWRETDFWKKSPVESAYTLWVKNFVEIALPCSVKRVFALMQKFKMAAKSGGKMIFAKSHQ